MLGLEWKDIDWEHNVISVRRTSNYNSVNGVYTDTTKTKNSKRSSKFPSAVMELLRELKAEQEKERERLGDKWVETDRLFTKWNGEPMGNSTPYNWLKKVCKNNGLRFCDLHSLRHINNMKTSLLKIRLKSHISPHKKNYHADYIYRIVLLFCFWFI